MTIKGSLQMSIPIVKAFLMRKVPSKIGQKFAFLGGGNWVEMYKYNIVFGTTRRHILARNNVI